MNPTAPWLDRLGIVVDLTSLVQEQRIVVNQTRCIQDQKQDALDDALLADNNAEGLLENQRVVLKNCCSAVADAQDALDNAKDTLEDATTLLKIREAACKVAGDNLCGLHYSFEDASDVHLAAENYLQYLEKSLGEKIRQLIDQSYH